LFAVGSRRVEGALEHVRSDGGRCRWLVEQLGSNRAYYNQTRTHLALRKDAPLRRAVQGSGIIIATPILFGLHHRYTRI
jgi:hypothetical protein